MKGKEESKKRKKRKGNGHIIIFSRRSRRSKRFNSETWAQHSVVVDCRGCKRAHCCRRTIREHHVPGLTSKVKRKKKNNNKKPCLLLMPRLLVPLKST